MRKKYYASCSGGKDSVAMIEKIIDAKMTLDEIVFAEVEKEFKQEKEHRELLIKRWEAVGIKCVVLKTKTTWDHWFYGRSVRGKSKGLKRGFPLTAYACWWTREAKVKPLDEYMKGNYRYIGIALDEPRRYREHMEKEGYIYPLFTEFKMTEKDCRDLCEERGILNPLYQYFDRLGCFLCPKQNDEALKTLCKHFKKEWKELIRYAEDTYSDSFVLKGQFNIKTDLEKLYEIEIEIN